MINAKIEINEQGYLISLSKKDFSLEFLTNFLEGILNDGSYTENKNHGDIISRTFNYDNPNRFDHLDDK